MAKIRVYQLAKEMGLASKDVVAKLQELGVDVKTHMSSLTEEEVEIFTKFLKEKREKKPPEPQKPPERVPFTETKEKKIEAAPVAKRREEAKELSPFIYRPRTRPKRRKKRRRIEEVEERDAFPGWLDVEEGIVGLPEAITVKELAALLGEEMKEVQGLLLRKGVAVEEDLVIPFDLARVVVESLGFKVKKESEEIEEEEAEGELVSRPPVVTVMGHVDHGKTTLLDYIRKTHVVEREAGGITQHIGAYRVRVSQGEITFIDTPGHHAFTTMRARGAQVTDIVVLIVAADDGVMPQTIEAIDHAKAANVPIIVAINKIDKPNANPERVKQDLSKYGLVPEDWGGEAIFVEISAKHGINVDELLEMIILQAEMLELKANPARPPKGTVLESKLDNRRGPVATLLVKEGTLRLGDPLVAGLYWGKVRAMFDDQGTMVKEAGPSMPVEILGLTGVPLAGEPFMAMENERKAREISEERLEKKRGVKVDRPKISLEEMMKQLTEGGTKELRILLKADVQGSLEALKDLLNKLGTEEVKIKIMHAGVGGINESDVMLASASKAVVLGFNVRPDSQARQAAEKEKVEIRLHRVIYDFLEDIKRTVEGMLEPQYEEVILGRAEVRQVFQIPKVGKVAGSYVLEGRVIRNAKVRLIRDGIVVREGSIASLRRFKEDVKEVAGGYECGIGIQDYDDIKEKDIIEVFEVKEVPRKL